MTLLGWSRLLKTRMSMPMLHIWCLFCAVLSYGVTISAACAPFAVFFLGTYQKASQNGGRPGWRKVRFLLLHSVCFGLCFLVVVMVLHVLQHQIYPLIVMPFSSTGSTLMRWEIGRFMTPAYWTDPTQWLEVWFAYMVENIVAPAVGLELVVFKGASHVLLSFQSVLTSPGFYIYVIFAAACVLAVCRNWRQCMHDEIFLVCAGWWILMYIFHVAYHASSPYVYALKMTFPLLYILASGYARLPRYRLAALCLLVIVVFISNCRFMGDVDVYLGTDLMALLTPR
jgi:hypothetical protein